MGRVEQNGGKIGWELICLTKEGSPCGGPGFGRINET